MSNPWGQAANAYGQEMDRLTQIQGQGMQQQAQLPMQLYQSFTQGYRDAQERKDKELQQAMAQKQYERQMMMAELAQQKEAENEQYRRSQSEKDMNFKAQKEIGDVSTDLDMNYQPGAWKSFKQRLTEAYKLKGMGQVEAEAAAENHNPMTKEAGPASDNASMNPPEPVLADKFTGKNILKMRLQDAQQAAVLQQGEDLKKLTLQQQADLARQGFETRKEIAQMGASVAAGRQAKPPIGYMWTQDGAGLVAIPGGPADNKLKGEASAKAAKASELEATLTGLMNDANELINDKDLGDITGVSGKLKSKIPFFPAEYGRGVKLSRLSSAGMLATIEKLKSQSKTGATGFGQLSNQEGEIIRKALADLDNYQSEPLLKEQLGRIVKFANDALERNRNNLGDAGGGQASPAAGQGMKEGTVSASGKFVWRGGAWVPNK